MYLCKAFTCGCNYYVSSLFLTFSAVDLSPELTEIKQNGKLLTSECRELVKVDSGFGTQRGQ
jgi:hypothetical protein